MAPSLKPLGSRPLILTKSQYTLLLLCSHHLSKQRLNVSAFSPILLHKIGERITAFGSSPKAVLSFELCSPAIGAGRELIRLVVERKRLAALLAGVLPSAGLFSCFRHTITSANNCCYYYSQKNSNNTSFPFFCGEPYGLSIIIHRSLSHRSRPMQT